MKKNVFAVCLLTLALLLSACVKANTGTQISVYRTISPYYRTSGEIVAVEKATFRPGVGIINSAISAFNAAPSNQALTSPLPEGGRIMGYELNHSALRLETEGCDALQGADLTLLRCCVVLTFCTIDGVDTVSIYSGEEELCPPLSADAILLTDTSVN